MKTIRSILPGLLFALAPLAIASGPSPAPAADGLPAKGKAEHVLVIAWDGLRPDLVTEQNTPTLYKLSREGTFFAHHHAVYPTTTEVNGTAIATGVYPEHSGIIANREYRPTIDPHASVATESLATIRKGDEVSGGKYVAVPTIAELVQAAGFTTAVAGTKPVALLQDRSEVRGSDAAKRSIDVFSGKANPPDALPAITSAEGNFPEMVSFPNAAEDSWTAKTLTEALWKNGVPKFSLLWMSDPDYSQHNTAPGAPVGLAALKSCDDRLATVLAALEAKGVRDKTDVFIVSDHGFSTIDDGVDVAKVLTDAGFPAVREFTGEPQRGQILVVSLGGSVAFYVVEHDPDMTQRLVRFLQGAEFTGILFTKEPAPGTFSLEQARIDTPAAPDVMLACRWSDHKNRFGVAGSLASDVGKRLGQGMHGSLSPFDLHNTFIGAGPDLRPGWTDDLPTGNVDVAPTVLWLLGVKAPEAVDGRVLFEALNGVESAAPKPQENVVEASVELEKSSWRQRLKTVQMDKTVYFEEGVGESTPK